MLFLLQAQLRKSAVLMFLERETPSCTCKPFLTAYMKASKQKAGFLPLKSQCIKAYNAKANKAIPIAIAMLKIAINIIYFFSSKLLILLTPH